MNGVRPVSLQMRANMLQKKNEVVTLGMWKTYVGQNDADWDWYVNLEERKGTTTAYRTVSRVDEDLGHRRLMFDDQCAGSTPCHCIYLLCLCHTDMTHTLVLPFMLCLLSEIACGHMSCVCQTNGLDDDASCQHYVRTDLHAVGARACLNKSCADYIIP